MKVSELRSVLDNMSDDEDIFALLYTKEIFDFSEDDDMTLTVDGWAKLVAELDELPFNELWEDIYDGVLDVAVLKDKNED